MKGIWYMAGTVNPTKNRLTAHNQKFFARAVTVPPITNTPKQMKNDNFRPHLIKKII